MVLTLLGLWSRGPHDVAGTAEMPEGHTGIVLPEVRSRWGVIGLPPFLCSRHCAKAVLNAIHSCSFSEHTDPPAAFTGLSSLTASLSDTSSSSEYR